jgi:hypothetical protein
MIKFVRNICVVVLCLIFSVTGSAQQGFNVPVPTNSPPTTQAPTQNLQDPYSGLTNGPGMYQEAETGQRQSNTGRNLALATGVFCGVMAVPACSTPPTPKCKWWLACVGAAAAGAIALGGSERTSRQSQEDLTGGRQGNVPRVNCPGCADEDLDINSEDPDERRLAGQIRQLERNGFRIDRRTGVVTDPQGRRFSAETFRSPERMRAAGISGLSMADVRAMEQQVQQAAANASGGVDRGEQGLGLEAGVGGRAGSAPGLVDAPMPSEMRGPSVAGATPPSVAGSSVNFNGIPIGVRMDDIFGMMSRRYNLEERREGFLGPRP